MRLAILTLLFWLLCLSISGQTYRISFYNFENAFDWVDDSLTIDEEFTPEGDRRWTEKKARAKLTRMSKVLLDLGEWESPDLLGMCEIENRFVIECLLKDTPLKSFKYRVVHQESPDRRGIDVAMIYRSDKLTLLEQEFIPIIFTFDTARKTRDIAYAMFRLNSSGDTIHVYVNHWPSRWGGQLESEPGRLYTAQVLKSHIESVDKKYSNANIIALGDFNDEPKDKSMIEVLGAKHPKENSLLHNLMLPLEEQGEGSHKYQGKWGILDQIVVSKPLLQNNGLQVVNKRAQIFRAPYLLENDEQDLGQKPFRTFVGMTYHGGFSDHLPVYIDLSVGERFSE